MCRRILRYWACGHDETQANQARFQRYDRQDRCYPAAEHPSHTSTSPPAVPGCATTKTSSGSTVSSGAPGPRGGQRRSVETHKASMLPKRKLIIFRGREIGTMSALPLIGHETGRLDWRSISGRMSGSEICLSTGKLCCLYGSTSRN